MIRLTRIVVLLSCLLLTGSAFATTYYIDYVSGNDSNNGISKATPWKHAPGMQGCTGSCSSANPKGGDNIILKGGVTWPNAALGWSFTWSGSSSTSQYGCSGSGCIYIGVDQTWYTGSSWTRPILNGNGSAVGSTNTFLLLTCNYCTLDNIEFTGFFYDADRGYGQDSYINFSVNKNGEIKNSYFHGWSHKSSTNGISDSGAAIIGSTQACPPDGAGGNAFSSWHDNVIDGSDTSRDMMDFSHGGPALVYNNYAQYVTNGTVGYNKWVYQNTFIHFPQSFDSGKHENGIESTNCQGIYFNNVLADILGSPIFHSPVDNYVDYDFNNVLYDSPVQQIQIDNSSLTSGKGSGIYIFNDTIEEPSSVSYPPINGPARTGSPNLPFMTVQNNILITNGTTFINWGKTTTQGASNNVNWSNAAATTKGYTANETFPYQVPVGVSPEQAGNLSSFCSNTVAGILPPSVTTSVCTNDTTAGVGYDTTAHVVIVPSHSADAHPQTGAWAAGAFEASNGNNTPQAPQNLAAVVQ